MLDIRRDVDIHREQGGWFDARWHFSFDRYRDPDRMGIGPLRVFNDDRLVAGADWPMHPHADVEGLTNPEIGEILKLSLPAVKSRLHRGRLLMRDALAPHFEEARP